MVKLVGTPQQISNLVKYFDGGSDHHISVMTVISSNLNYHKQKALGLLGYPVTNERAIATLTGNRTSRIYDKPVAAPDYTRYLSEVLDPRD